MEIKGGERSTRPSSGWSATSISCSYSGQVTHGRTRKYYKPTPGGQAYFREKLAEWELTKDVIDKLLEDEHSENQTTR